MKPQSVSMNVDSGEKTWLTPRYIIEALGHFDTDPCCPPSMPWRTADTMLTKAEDGTVAPWHGRVWLNPPYGREAYPFLSRMATYAGGVSRLSSSAPTPANGTNGYSQSHTPSCSSVGVCGSVARTEVLRNRAPRRLPSSPIPRRTPSLLSKAASKEHS
jgi:hypothetical protein